MITRRDFIYTTVLATGAIALGKRGRSTLTISPVVIVRTEDRKEGIRRAINQFHPVILRGKSVVIKPNFNSADPFPGSTHASTLRVLLEYIKENQATEIVVAERSGMSETEHVMKEKDIPTMARLFGFKPVVLDALPSSEWNHYELTHWKRGVDFPKFFTKADTIIQTCCLKTHRFGGHFTISLKNSVGMVAKYSPENHYDYMRELHSSPYQRIMIAEINKLYRPSLIVLDGMKAFVDGGPEAGKVVEPGVIVVGTDRVAIDAVGVAILRLMGTNRTVSSGRIFEQEQIRRAVELGLGVTGPNQIELVTNDEESKKFAKRVEEVLSNG